MCVGWKNKIAIVPNAQRRREGALLVTCLRQITGNWDCLPFQSPNPTSLVHVSCRKDCAASDLLPQPPPLVLVASGALYSSHCHADSGCNYSGAHCFMLKGRVECRNWGFGDGWLQWKAEGRLANVPKISLIAWRLIFLPGDQWNHSAHMGMGRSDMTKCSCPRLPAVTSALQHMNPLWFALLLDFSCSRSGAKRASHPNKISFAHNKLINSTYKKCKQWAIFPKQTQPSQWLHGKVGRASGFRNGDNEEVTKTCFLSSGQQGPPMLVAKRH